MTSALEIGAADLTPAARSTTALQIGPPRLAAAQSRAIMWRASPAAASCFLPDYGVHPHRRQTTRTTKSAARSAALNRMGDDAVAISALACSDILHANHVACSSRLQPRRVASPSDSCACSCRRPVASDSESSDPVHFMVYLPLFALPQRSVETLSPSAPPPPQPPSDHRQLCRRLSDLPPLAPLPSAPRCRSSATWKDRSSSASLTFARSCQPVCGGGAVLAAQSSRGAAKWMRRPEQDISFPSFPFGMGDQTAASRSQHRFVSLSFYHCISERPFMQLLQMFSVRLRAR